MQTVSVIVSKCTPAGDRVYGDRLVDATFRNPDDASTFANTLCQQGKSVIVRPNYNETDETGKRYFREWRSFNGEPLREVKFGF